MTPEFCIQWRDEDLTEEGMEERAQWLGEPRQLASGCENFFALAGMPSGWSGRYESTTRLPTRCSGASATGRIKRSRSYSSER